MKSVFLCFAITVLLPISASALNSNAPGFLVTQINFPSLTGNIFFGTSAGVPLQNRITTAGAPNDVEVFAGHIYWTEDNTRSLLRADLDGSNIQRLFTGPQGPLVDHPVGLAIDRLDGRIYWATIQTNLIRVADLDGSDPSTLPLPEGATPYALAIDTSSRDLFWTSAFDKRIYRMNLDTQVSQLIVTDVPSLPSLFGLAVDPTLQKVYWTNREGPVVRRANYDGSSVETLVTGTPGAIFRDIEIDVANRAMLWVDDRQADAFIRRANLDGSNVQTLGMTQSQSGGLALVPEPDSIAILLVGLAGMTRRYK